MKTTIPVFVLLVLILAGCGGGPSNLDMMDEINAVRDQQVLDWREEISSGPGSESEKQAALDALNAGMAVKWMDFMADSQEKLKEVARENWDKGEAPRRKAIQEAALKLFKEAHPEFN